MNLDELDLSEYDKYLADSVFCNRIIGYGHKWTYTETCNCP